MFEIALVLSFLLRYLIIITCSKNLKSIIKDSMKSVIQILTMRRIIIVIIMKVVMII